MTSTLKQIKPFLFPLLVLGIIVLMTLTLRAQQLHSIKSDKEAYRIVGRNTDSNREVALIQAIRNAKSNLVELLDVSANVKENLEAVGYQASEETIAKLADIKHAELEKLVAEKSKIIAQDIDYKKREGLYYAAAAAEVSVKDVRETLKRVYFKKGIQQVGDRKNEMEGVLEKETGNKPE